MVYSVHYSVNAALPLGQYARDPLLIGMYSDYVVFILSVSSGWYSQRCCELICQHNYNNNNAIFILAKIWLIILIYILFECVACKDIVHVTKSKINLLRDSYQYEALLINRYLYWNIDDQIGFWLLYFQSMNAWSYM